MGSQTNIITGLTPEEAEAIMAASRGLGFASKEAFDPIVREELEKMNLPLLRIRARVERKYRWLRFKRRIIGYRWRVATAIGVLRGKHYDCDYC